MMNTYVRFKRINVDENAEEKVLYTQFSEYT